MTFSEKNEEETEEIRQKDAPIIVDPYPNRDDLKFSIRDRVYTKEELKKLEKKHWSQVKDIVFETDIKIL